MSYELFVGVMMLFGEVIPASYDSERESGAYVDDPPAGDSLLTKGD
jgi:hypothetical protein